jgi:hypothetical protein
MPDNRRCEGRYKVLVTLSNARVLDDEKHFPSV